MIGGRSYLMGNQIRTTILLAVMTALIIWVGQLLGGRQGMLIALIFAAGMNFFSYWYSDKLVLSLFSTHPPLEERIARLRGAPPPATGKAGPEGDNRAAKAKAAWNRLSDDRGQKTDDR